MKDSKRVNETIRKVYFITDKNMLLHKCEWDTNHIETPSRLEGTLKILQQSGILEECEILQSRKADLSEVCLVHDETYVKQIAASKNMNLSELEQLSSCFEDVYLNKHSFDAALLSTGCALQAMEAVLDECETAHKAAFAAIRPPGHHASGDRACGFCIFNNVAICAKKARYLGANRILIIDWDVHAGQGTQYAIKDDPEILLISIHRYEHGKFWPNLPESGVVTEYANTINIPLNTTGVGDTEYMEIVKYLVLPILYDFEPSLILISCGFDAALGDPEGEMAVTPGGYQWILHVILEEGRKLNASVCVLMEGGYLDVSNAFGTEFCLKAMLDRPLPYLDLVSCNKEVLKTIYMALTCHFPRFRTLELFASVALEFRKRSKMIERLSVQEFAKSEYQGKREVFFPYPTRGVYAARNDTIQNKFRSNIRKLVSNYVYRKRDPKLMIDLSSDCSQNLEELYTFHLSHTEEFCAQTVLNFFRIFVSGHSCDICGSEIDLRSDGKLTQPEDSNTSDRTLQTTTIQMIVDNLLKIFDLGYCSHLKSFLLCEALL